MRNYLLLLYLTSLLLVSLTGRGQSTVPPYSIVYALSGSSGSNYRIELTRNADYVRLRYGRLDSVQSKRLHNDPKHNALVAALESQQLSTAEIKVTLQQLSTIYPKYEVYRWDSLQVATNTHQSLLKAIDAVYASSAAELERLEANRGRVVLDGTMVHVVVKSRHKTETDLYVDSPRSTSHPQIYSLLHETLQLYRQERPNAFLDQRYTHGY